MDFVLVEMIKKFESKMQPEALFTQLKPSYFWRLQGGHTPILDQTRGFFTGFR